MARINPSNALNASGNHSRFCYWSVSIALALGLCLALMVLVPRIAFGAEGCKCNSRIAAQYSDRDIQCNLPAKGDPNYRNKEVTRSPTCLARKNASIAIITSYIRRSQIGLECRLHGQDVLIADPWSGDVDSVPVEHLHISVEHPRVGRSDPEPYGLRTPLTVSALAPADESGSPRQCVFYSMLIDPEHVSSTTWSNIDRLLAALMFLGASVERWRPLEDPSKFDEGTGIDDRLEPSNDAMSN